MQNSSIGSDAERLAAIQKLEQAIATKEAARKSALSARDAAKHTESERQNAVRGIENEIRLIGTSIRRNSRAAYLNGQSLDRGTLQLGNELVRFVGWRGSVEIPLTSIEAVDVGTSLLSPRAGVPILGRVWPGTPRSAQSLILTIRQTEQDESRSLAVMSDLLDSEVWQSEILKGQTSLEDVAAQRAKLESRRQTAMTAHMVAENILKQAQAQVDSVDAEIAPLRAQRDKLRAQQREVDVARRRALQAEKDRLKEAQRDAKKKGKK